MEQPNPTDPRPKSSPSAAEADRRRGDRAPARGRVHVTLLAQELDGQVENLSPGGMLLRSGARLGVLLRFEDQGEIRERRGRLVRVQRLSEHEAGWAIEFDPS